MRRRAPEHSATTAVTPPDDQLLTLQEAADLANVHVVTVRKWRLDATSGFPIVQFGPKSIRVPRQLFKEWLVERMRQLQQTGDGVLSLDVARRLPAAERWAAMSPAR